MRTVWLATTAGMFAFVGSAAVAEPIAAPILSGEVYAETANGCGIVVSPTDVAAGYTVLSTVDHFKKQAWYGRCVDGLVDGPGQFAEPGRPITLQRFTYVLGRNVADPWKVIRDEEKRETTYWSGDQFATVYDEPKPFGPRWAYDMESVSSPDGKSTALTSRISRCRDLSVQKKTKKFGCSDANNYRTYEVSVKLNGVYTTQLCPDPRTSEGCDELWLAAGKPVFDSIKAFVAPIQAGIAAQRARYLALITPEWRSQVAAKKDAVLANGTAGKLRDLVAAAVVGGDGVEAARLHQLLEQRFPASPAVAQSHLHLTALYCRQSAPALALTGEDAAETVRIFQSEPCRRTGLAEPLLFSSKIVVEAAGWQADGDAQHAASLAKYNAERRRERDAYWGSMLGVVTGVIANAVAQPAVTAATPTYSGNAAAAPGYGSPAVPSAFPGATSPASTGPAAANAGFNPGMFRIDPAAGCAQYTLLPAEGPGGWKYYQIRNGCNYGIHVNVLAEGDGREAHTIRQEIAPYATLKSPHGVLAKHMAVTIRAVCPGKTRVEAMLGKRVTGVYSHHGTAFGCWSMLENTGVGIGN